VRNQTKSYQGINNFRTI